MKEDNRSREELLEELVYLRQEVAQFQVSKEERLQVEEALRMSQERYRVLVEMAFAGISLTDSHENLTFVNPAMVEMLGYGEDELVGMNLSELADMEEFGRYRDLTQQRLQGLRNYYESRLYRKDGQSLNVLIYASPLTALDGSFEGTVAVVLDITQYRRAEEENIRLRQALRIRPGFSGIVARSKGMEQVMDLVEQIADSASSVVIEGETGTGKELIAGSLHHNSSRRNAPFLPINCGALPEHLLESELFGHERGAFTGAYARKVGLLQAAQGGTVFLDEISTLSLDLQVKMLRVLQERKLRRVGGNEFIDIDIRVVSATNESLEKIIEQGHFRRDLYYRLNVITIVLPPLRERLEDIPLLVEHFLEGLNQKGDKQIGGVAQETLELLQNYAWPGNVRELQNVVERAFLLTESGIIGPEVLPATLVQQGGEAPFAIDTHLSFVGARKSFESEYLGQLLQEYGGNVTRAAQQAGLHRSSFQRLIKKYGLEAGAFRGK